MTKGAKRIGPTDPAAQEAEAGLSGSQDSCRSGRALTDREELLPVLPVRIFNLRGHTGEKGPLPAGVCNAFNERSCFFGGKETRKKRANTLNACFREAYSTKRSIQRSSLGQSHNSSRGPVTVGGASLLRVSCW